MLKAQQEQKLHKNGFLPHEHPTRVHVSPLSI